MWLRHLPPRRATAEKAHLLGGWKERTDPTEGARPEEGFRGLVEEVRVNRLCLLTKYFPQVLKVQRFSV